MHMTVAIFVPRLTLWEPVYDIFVLWKWPKTSSFRLPYQCHNSSADCARELLKGSNELDSLLDYTRKKFFWLGLRIFVTDVISEVAFGPFKSTNVSVCFRGISRLPSAFVFLQWFKLAHISIQVCTFHDGCKQGIDQQIFNRKSISRKTTHPQSLLK